MMTGNLAGFYVQTLRATLAGLDVATPEELAAEEKALTDALVQRGVNPQVAQREADRMVEALTRFGRDVENLRASTDYLIEARQHVRAELYRGEEERQNG